MKRFVTKLILFSLPPALFCTSYFFLTREDGLNEWVLAHQLAKLHRNSDATSIVVGDSSAANAFDAELFSVLSGEKTLNLGLTGSFGLAGTLNVIQSAKTLLPNLKNVLIVQTLDLWRRPFSKTGFLLTLSNSNDQQEFTSRVNLSMENPVKVIGKIKVLFWPVKNWLYKSNVISLDPQTDYISKRRKQFSNGMLSDSGVTALSDIITKDKVMEWEALVRYCAKNGMNCIYLHAPILDKMSEISTGPITQINNLIKDAEAIKVVTSVLTLPSSEMGDSWDHVSTQARPKVTKRYFEWVQDLLVENQKQLTAKH